MKIWIIINTNMLPEHGHLNRSYYLGKYLKRLGHEPTVFVGSHPHNTDLQLIEGKEYYKVYQEEPFPWVLIKTRNYEGSKKARVISMFEFYFNMLKAAKRFERPDVIIGSSTHPLAPLAAIKLGKKYKCQKIVEIRDLWPESVVAYGVLSKNNLLVKLCYRLEKYLYIHADKLIFTMENAWQYFIDKGLDKIISKDKVHYLNNGVDLELFNYNLEHYPYSDVDLSEKDTFKVVYAGSIRKVNNVGLILDVAKLVMNPKVRFIIFGDGDELPILRKRVENEEINNVIFKGLVDKKFIPSITNQADLNYMHGSQSTVLKYGLSANKLFDYAAAGKPILLDIEANNNPAERFGAALSIKDQLPEEIADKIDRLADMPNEEYEKYGSNALKLSSEYSWENLARKCVRIISGED